MRPLRDLPIARKLMVVSALPAAIALLLASIILTIYEHINYRQQKMQEISVQAEILAASVAAAVEFNDAKTAQEYLNALAANPAIVAAGVYGIGGERIASHSRAGSTSRLPPERSAPRGQHVEGDDLLLFWPIKHGQRELGAVFLRTALEAPSQRAVRYGSTLLLLMLGTLALTLPLARRLHGTIAGPIRQMAAAARQIADGDLNVALASEAGRSDEIGVLLDSFGQMLSSLQEMTHQIGEVSEILASSTADILVSASQVAASSQETAAALGQTGVTVEEVKQTAQLAAQKASEVAESTQRTAQVSKAGLDAVEQSIEAMEHIQEQTELVTESIVYLSEQGLALGEIITIMNNLAEQSNMLAVNAAIEATKVGDVGKGFAVVAQEVKSLAEQSRQATAQVRIILQDIQKSTAKAVLSTEQSSKAVETGVKLSAEAESAIRALAQSMAQAVQAAVQIASSAHQQQAGTDQLALAMQNIREGSSQNAVSARQSESVAQELHQLGLRLKQLLEKYRK